MASLANAISPGGPRRGSSRLRAAGDAARRLAHRKVSILDLPRGSSASQRRTDRCNRLKEEISIPGDLCVTNTIQAGHTSRRTPITETSATLRGMGRLTAWCVCAAVASAIWDGVSKRLLLARDRLREAKPALPPRVGRTRLSLPRSRDLALPGRGNEKVDRRHLGVPRVRATGPATPCSPASQDDAGVVRGRGAGGH